MACVKAKTEQAMCFVQLLPGFSIRYWIGHNRYKETEKIWFPRRASELRIWWNGTFRVLTSEANRNVKNRWNCCLIWIFQIFFWLRSVIELNSARLELTFRNSMCPVESRDIPDFSLHHSVIYLSPDQPRALKLGRIKENSKFRTFFQSKNSQPSSTGCSSSFNRGDIILHEGLPWVV